MENSRKPDGELKDEDELAHIGRKSGSELYRNSV